MDSEVLIIIISVLLSAFFSGLEIAFVSADKLEVALEKKKQGLSAKLLTRLTEKSSKFITTMLVGNNLALVVYSYYMGDKIIHLLPPITNDVLLLLIQTLISTLIILVTAEFLPKAIFRVYANETLRIFAFPATFFYYLFFVLSWTVELISNTLLKLFFNTQSEEEETEFSKEELGFYINKQLENGTEDENLDAEIQIFQNALSFNTVKAREIMVPRTDIEATDLHENIQFLKNQFVSTGFSKIIVYKTSLDDIVGYAHAFDLFKKPRQIKSILHPVEYVPETILINDLLNILTKKRKSIAVVIDEYGGTSGIITIEDIVEELFGEIEDEHDKLMLTEQKINTNEYHLSARLEIDYLNETYHLNIPKSESYETLGGYIIEHLEDIPKKNDEFTINHLFIKINKVTTTRIEEVYIKHIPKE